MAALDEPAAVPVGADPREPGPTHWIARERIEPAREPRWWLAALAAMALAVFGLLLAFAGSPGHRLASEQAFQQSDGFLQAVQALLGTSAARGISAAAAATLVFCTGFLARRILHHDLAALLAASLVAIDPALLLHGRVATPVAPSAALAVAAAAMFLGRRTSTHWWASGALAFAAFLDPVHLLWCLPLAAMTLVRGHIYAAPQHAYLAGLQAIVVPVLGAAAGLAGGASLHGCHAGTGWRTLFLLRATDLGGVLAIPNPVTWFGGLVALSFLAAWSLGIVVSNFRLQRLPGRVQIRLPEPLRRIHGRSLWIALLAVTAPMPLLWVPLFATALGAGLIELGRDSKAFGIVVGLAILLFAAIATFQGIEAIRLEPAASFLPWTAAYSC